MAVLPRPPLLSVALVLQSKDRLGGLSHVAESISTFLDAAAMEKPLSYASGFNSIPLLERIWNSSSPETEASPAAQGPGHGGEWSRRRYLRTDKHYSRCQFDHCMHQAVEFVDNKVATWLFDHFEGCIVFRSKVESAASKGNVELLQLFLDRCTPMNSTERTRVLEPGTRHFVEWGHRELNRAISAKQDETALWLLRNAPDQHIDNDVACSAVRRGDIAMLDWAYARNPAAFDDSWNLMRYAAEEGHSHVVQWLYQRGGIHPESAREVLGISIQQDNLQMVKWLLEVKVVEALQALEVSMAHGRIEIARYVYDNYWGGICGVKSYPLPYSKVSNWDDSPRWNATNTFKSAAQMGSLDVVRWMVETFGNAHNVDLFETNEETVGRSYLEDVTAIDAAASNGHLPLVIFLHDLAIVTATTKAMDGAASSNHLDVIQWLHNNRDEGCTTNAMDYAADSGHLEMVKWLHENRMEGCTTRAMDCASAEGHLDIVKWLLDNRTEGCTTRAMDNAASYEYLEVVKWLHENSNAKCTTRAMDSAAKNGDLNMLMWLHENRSEGCTTAATDKAARNGHLEIVKWLHQNRNEGWTAKAIEMAVRENKLEVVRWLYENRSELFSSELIPLAATCGGLETLLFLHSKCKEECPEIVFKTDLFCEYEIVYEWCLAHYPDQTRRE